MFVILENKIKISALIFISAILMGIISVGILYLVDENSLLYYGDAVSHLNNARRFVDSDNPGIIQLGTVWLPLPHIMMMPFSLVDSLFSSGFAGLVNLPLHALTSVLIYKIILTQTKRPWIAIIGGLLYASNPNLLYLGITAMTEAPFLLFFVASIYFLQKWITQLQNNINLKYILLSSLFISLATLCRYEAWVLAPALVLFAIFFGLKKSKNKKIITLILFSFIAFSGIIFWTGWNQLMYDDPLEFANAEFYAASSQAVERPNRDLLFLQPQNVLYVYGAASMMVFGPILLSFAVVGYFSHLREKVKTFPSSIYFFMILPVLFTLLTMLIGIGEMNMWWFNSRFATFLAPLVIILVSVALLRIEKFNKKVILGIIVIGLFAFQISSPTFGVVTHIDADGGWNYKQAPFAKQTSDFLYENYDDGEILIMTGSSQAHRIMISSGVDLIDYNEGIESLLSKSFFQEPWKYNKWIVIGTEPDSDSVNAVKFWEKNMDELMKHYDQEYENKFYKVLKLK